MTDFFLNPLPFLACILIGENILEAGDLLLTEHNEVSRKMALIVIFSDVPGNVELGEYEQSFNYMA